MTAPAAAEPALGAGVAAKTKDSDVREANEHLVLAALEALASKEAAAQATIRRQEEFLAMLAHELRNPLAPIRTAAALLDRIGSPEPAVRLIREVIQRQVDHMARLLDDLLDASRVTSGKVTLQRHPTAVSEFVGQAVETFKGLIEARRQELNIDMPAAPLFVDGDPVRLAQIVGNLLHNASKYTPEDGAITLSTRRDGDSVVIKISDNGIGLSTETLPHIFELFNQNDRSLSRSQGGLGIGLTVVQSMLELHGGTVEARSAGLDQGSEFIVTLPRIEAIVEPVIQPREYAASGRARVLLIDDNADAGVVLSMLLEISGHDVTVARDGPSGLQIFAETQPDVVLCDIGLPGMDGYEVAALMRSQCIGTMPVMIALTGYNGQQDRELVMSAGFDHHVVKPANPDDLLRLIDSALIRARQPETRQ